MSEPIQTSQTGQSASGARRHAAAPDLPLIIEQLQDQIDQLRATIEAQQTLLEQHTARLAALDRH